MVICSVYGCSNRSGRDDYKVKFFRVPSVRSNCTAALKTLSANRRALWLLRICREDLDDARAAKNGARVCSKHFVSGSPSILEDITNPDWAPSLHLGHDFFDGRRRPRKRKKESTEKCICNSYDVSSEFQRNYKSNLKQNLIDDDTSCASKNACCYMNVEESDDSETERSLSSPETDMSYASESSSEVKESSLITEKPENSQTNECVTLITVTSEDTGSILIQPSYARSILKPNHVQSILDPEYDLNTIINSEDTPSAHTAQDVDFKTEISMESDEDLLTTDKFKDNFSDDDNLYSAQENDLHDIHNEYSQTTFSESISESKNFNASGQISCATHAEAFSAAETLIRYIMNQDEVNDVDLNFILNFAQKIKEKMS